MSASTERRVIVTWKNDESRAIVPVAELLIDEDAGRTRYQFGYLAGVEQALSLGFQPFLAFPDFARRYASDRLFPFFQNRVLPSTRPDYLESLLALGLNPDEATFAELFGRGNGRRATDRIETFLVPSATDDRYTTHFLVRAVRHVNGAEDVAAQLRLGDALRVELESTNEWNPRARLLVAEAGTVGYLPDYLVPDVDALEAAGVSPSVVVERVNPPPQPAHHRLLCRLESGWPEGFEPMRDPRLERYAPTIVAATG